MLFSVSRKEKRGGQAKTRGEEEEKRRGGGKEEERRGPKEEEGGGSEEKEGSSCSCTCLQAVQGFVSHNFRRRRV